MSYNFDMQRLLDTFGGDAEKLAQAFADSLNSELAKQRQRDYITDAAQDVADAWGEFVDEYFDENDLPDGMDEEDFYIDAEVVKGILNLFIKLLPYFDLAHEYIEKLEGLNKEVSATAHKVADNVKNSDVYEDVMKRFFKNNGIS